MELDQSLNLRLETPADGAAIFTVNSAAFPGDAEARLVDALRHAGRLHISMVAETAGQIVGHVAFSPVTIPSQPSITGGIGLGPVAVLPDFQRQGIGSALCRAGLQACAQAGYTFVVVLGAPAYYQRFGFLRASQFGLGNEFGVDNEFMAQALCQDGLPTVAGIVSYAPEFSLV